MSRPAAAVPNAWDDDDWVSQADKGPPAAAAAAAPPPALNRHERLQQHAEANRRLWESADSAETFHYIEASSGGAPLAAAPFRPQVKVLSRKPAPGPSAPGDDDPDPDGRRNPGARVLSPDEIRAKQRRERDEKQRRYDEARAKIFGESAPSSRGSSPGAGAGAVTPPRSEPRGGSSSSSARGRARPNGNGYRANSSYGSGSGSTTLNTGGNPASNAGNHSPSGAHYFENRRPANPAGPTRELYDPNSSPRPEFLGRGRGVGSGENSPRVQTPRTDHPQQQQQQQQLPQQYQQQFSSSQQQHPQHHAIRAPRGPDSSGRGGFGLARRGARET